MVIHALRPVVGAPIGGHGGSIRPYAVGGVGLIRTNLQDFAGAFDVSSKNDFGFDVGGGVMGYFAQNIGIRGDIRYFRSFTGSDNNATGLGLSEPESFRWIQKAAMDRRLSMREVADAVLAGTSGQAGATH